MKISLLNTCCESVPTGCFHTAILVPLIGLETPRNSTKFILMDALDECLGKGVGNTEIRFGDDDFKRFNYTTS